MLSLILFFSASSRLLEILCSLKRMFWGLKSCLSGKSSCQENMRTLVWILRIQIKEGYAGACNLIYEPVQSIPASLSSQTHQLKVWEESLEKGKNKWRKITDKYLCPSNPQSRGSVHRTTHTHSKLFVIPSESNQRLSPKQLILLP